MSAATPPIANAQPPADQVFDLIEASESRWKVGRPHFAVCLGAGIFVALTTIAFGIGTEIKVEQQGLGVGWFLTYLAVFGLAFTSALFAIGVARSKLPGAISLRVSHAGVELRRRAGGRQRWSWKDAGTTFLILDYSNDPAAVYFQYNRYLVGPHFWSIRNFVTKEALDAVLENARLHARDVREVSQTFWALGIRQKWIVTCG